MPKDFLSKSQLAVVSQFLTERLHDEECIPEILLGLKSVVSMANFQPSVSLKTIITDVADGIPMRKLAQNIRFTVFQFLDLVYKKHHTYIGNYLGVEFLKTYAVITNGEKDPRNLLLSFTLCQNILTNLDTAVSSSPKLVDDIFDVTFCYFPITFEPPKNDPYKISSNELRLSLRAALASNGALAKYTIPGLIEKLTTTNPAIKEDVLVTLAACIKNYDPESVKEHWEEVWDGIKYEVLHGTDEDTTKHAGSVLMQLGTSLAKCIDETHLHNYLESAKTETKGKLEEPQSKLSMPAALLLVDIAKSGPKAYQQLSEFAITILLNAYTKSPTTAKQKAVLEILIKFLEAAAYVDEKFDGAGSAAITRFKDDLIGVFSRALMGSEPSEVSLRLVALNGLEVSSTKVSNYLNESELGLVGQYLDTLILEDSQNEICKAALGVQLRISHIYPEHVTTITFPALLAALPNARSSTKVIDATSVSHKGKSLDYLLHSLAYLTQTRSTLEMLSVRLINTLDGDSDDVNYVAAVLSTLLSVIVEFDQKSGSEPSPLLMGYLFKFMPRLITKVYDPRTRREFSNDKVVNLIGSMLSILSRNSSEKEQTILVTELLNLFYYEGKNSKLVNVEFVPYLSSPSRAPTNIVNIFTMSIAPVSGTQEELREQAPFLISNALKIVSKSNESYERLGYLRLLCLICNKWITPADAANLPNEIDGNGKLTLNDVEIIAWICKGLILKNDSLGYTILKTMILSKLGDDGSVGLGAGKILGAVAAEDSILNKNNGLNVRLLYRQRFFTVVLPALVDGYKQANSQTKVNYMVGLAGLLRFTPSNVISSQLSQFLPLLLESLQVDNAGVLKAAIDTIMVTVKDNSEVFREHLNSIISELLQLSSTHKSEGVRISAINVLGLLPITFEVQYLQPYRGEVIRTLGKVLDDRKREVRKAACICRQAYFELGMSRED